MSAPPHLPNEIWLQILSHTQEQDASIAKDLWLSLRPASSQLKACVEQYFHTCTLRHIRLFLPIVLPSYDQRNPLTGHAIFNPEVDATHKDLLWFALERTEPEYYLTQFLTRWEGMKVPSTGLLKEIVRWEAEFGGRRERMRFRDARASGDGESMKVGLQWMAMMTIFFKS